MIRLFLTKTLDGLKKLGYWINEQRRFVSVLFPSLGGFCLVAVWLYLSWKLSSLMPASSELDSISWGISNTIVYYRAKIIEFVFNNIGLISIVVVSILLGWISNWLNERKAKKRLPVVGIPNKDNVTVLLMLFNLRCIEIGVLYDTIRRFQKEADQKGEKGNWLELFLMDYLDCYNNSDYCPYSSESDYKREWRLQKNKETVSNLLKDKFNFDGWRFSRDCSSFEDLLIVLKKWDRDNINPIRLLQGMNTYGKLSNTISALTESYRRFDSYDSILFVYNKPFLSVFKSKVIKSHDGIEEIWKEIIFALKSSLVFLKTQNDTYFDVDKIFREIEALEALQDNAAIQKTIACARFSEREKGRSWYSDEDVNLILNKLEQNPLEGLL